MESGWNIWVWIVGVDSGCGEQEAAVASGCGFKEVLLYISSYYLSLLLLYLFFLQQHPYFLFIKKKIFLTCSSPFL